MVLATNGDAKKSPQQTSDECQCLCHQLFSNVAAGSFRLSESLIFREIGFACSVSFRRTRSRTRSNIRLK
jgi:hypothetical protein